MRCIRCGEEKKADAFGWRDKKRGKHFAHCRACQAKYHRQHYEKNRLRYLERATRVRIRLRDENQALLLEYLESHPCVDCGESDPIVLEFDHLTEKDFGVARALRYMTWKNVIAEIGKCEVVCGNCHRRRTAKRQGSVRLMLAKNMEERASG